MNSYLYLVGKDSFFLSYKKRIDWKSINPGKE